MNSQEDWSHQFNQKIKTKTYEQFSLLLIDLKNSSDEQKGALRCLLFEDHTSVKYWRVYISIVFRMYPNRKMQLQRLVNKALEFLDEVELKDNEDFIQIHIFSAELKSDKDALRYFQNVIWRKSIGRKKSEMFVAWAKLETDQNKPSIFEKGLDCGAQPIELLINAMKSYNVTLQPKPLQNPVVEHSFPVKPELSKYVDENLRNFNPAIRTRSSSRPQPITEKGAPSVLAKTNRRMELGSAVRVRQEEKNEVQEGTEKKRKRVSFLGNSSLEDLLPPTKKDEALPLSNLTDLIVNDPVIEKSDRNVETVQYDQNSLGQFLTHPTRQISLNGKGYVQLCQLGRGGSGAVYRVVSKEDGRVYAYKRVEVRGAGEGDSEGAGEVFDSFSNEIALLQKLSKGEITGPSQGAAGFGHPHVIGLVDFEMSREQGFISMLLEAGDIDLSKALARRRLQPLDWIQRGHSGGDWLDPFFTRKVWREMLQAVQYCHQNRIVHGDLKPANFVFVRGRLKLIDFGIAKAFSADTTNIYRAAQIGTVNYMAPEAISPFEHQEGATEVQGECSSESGTGSSDNQMVMEGDDNRARQKMRLGRASDVWSLGCILYQMVYGRPPFSALNTIQKLSAIPNPQHKIPFPSEVDGLQIDPDALESIKACLPREANLRAPIDGKEGLLSRPFLQVRCQMVMGKHETPLKVSVPQSGCPSSAMGTDTKSEVKLNITGDTSPLGRSQPSKSQLPSASIESVVDAVLKALDVQNPEKSLDIDRSILLSTVQSRLCSSGVVFPTINHEEIKPASRSGVDTPGELERPVMNGLLKNSLLASIQGRKDRPAATEIPPAVGTPQQPPSSSGVAQRGSSGRPRPPLRTLSLDLQSQIRNTQTQLQSIQSSAGQKRANRWMRVEDENEKQDMRSILERRIGEIRKFMELDEDTTATVTERTDFYDYF